MFIDSKCIVAVNQMKKIEKNLIIFLSLCTLNVCMISFCMEQKDKNKTGYKRKREGENSVITEEKARKKRKLTIGDTKVEEIKKKEPVECLFCYESISTQEEKKLRCQHIFHKICIQKYFQENDNRCPACRTSEFCSGCKKMFTQDDFIKDDLGFFRNVCKRPKREDILEKCEHEFHKNCLTDEYCKECPVPVCVQKMQEHRGIQEEPQQEAPTIESDSFIVTQYEDQVHVFNRSTNRPSPHVVTLKQANVESFDIYGDRFLLVEYPIDRHRKECEIFDLEDNNKKYTTFLQEKSILYMDILRNRFLVVLYPGDWYKKECDIFDLQKKVAYKKKVDFFGDTQSCYPFLDNFFIFVEDGYSQKFSIVALQGNANEISISYCSSCFFIVERSNEGKRSFYCLDRRTGISYPLTLKQKKVEETKLVDNTVFQVVYAADEANKTKEECDIFDLLEQKQYTIELRNEDNLSKADLITVFHNRFAMIVYTVGLWKNNDYLCDIFDLQEEKRYTKRGKFFCERGNAFWAIRNNRFFISTYYTDVANCYYVFDLQENKQYTGMILRQDCLGGSLYMRSYIKNNRFLVVVYDDEEEETFAIRCEVYDLHKEKQKQPIAHRTLYECDETTNWCITDDNKLMVDDVDGSIEIY